MTLIKFDRLINTWSHLLLLFKTVFCERYIDEPKQLYNATTQKVAAASQTPASILGVLRSMSPQLSEMYRRVSKNKNKKRKKS